MRIRYIIFVTTTVQAQMPFHTIVESGYTTLLEIANQSGKSFYDQHRNEIEAMGAHFMFFFDLEEKI